MDDRLHVPAFAQGKGPAHVDRRFPRQVMAQPVFFHEPRAGGEIRLGLLRQEILHDRLVPPLDGAQQAVAAVILAIPADADIEEVQGVLGHGGDEQLSPE